MPESRDRLALTIEDRRAVDDVLSAYALRLDLDDVDGAAALFAEDAEFVTYGRVFAGRARIRRMFASAPKGVHLAGRATVTPRPDGVDVTMQLVFFPADRAPHRLACYDVRMLRGEDESWTITRMETRFMNDEGAWATEP
ncbi:nuclear transport factor 2 family protein [Nocardia bovistercoris]|uniref:Nuclear transport factor 2 family protein n=1 Tax=Nocardia bovistercoris TaxID=2785916 RepID=A0A931MYQ6_9NOCA|nr:nuclear transport factor 2 family protein [Nocardia bovistercoris]